MKNKIATLLIATLAVVMTSCSENNDGPTVTPPSWKGFNYVVKTTVGDKTEQTERGAIKPGDEIKVYAVRKSVGKLIGEINGTIYIKYTAYMAEGAPQVVTLSKSALSIANDKWDGWEDPYATFTMPVLDGECTYYKVEAACDLYFKAFGNQNSEVDYGDATFHEAPYIGEIHTDLTNFHPLNGGSASTGYVAGELKYYTLYISTK